MYSVTIFLSAIFSVNQISNILSVCLLSPSVTTCTRTTRWWLPTCRCRGRLRWVPRCWERCSSITMPTESSATTSRQWVSQCLICTVFALHEIGDAMYDIPIRSRFWIKVAHHCLWRPFQNNCDLFLFKYALVLSSLELQLHLNTVVGC